MARKRARPRGFGSLSAVASSGRAGASSVSRVSDAAAEGKQPAEGKAADRTGTPTRADRGSRGSEGDSEEDLDGAAREARRERELRNALRQRRRERARDVLKGVRSPSPLELTPARAPGGRDEGKAVDRGEGKAPGDDASAGDASGDDASGDDAAPLGSMAATSLESLERSASRAAARAQRSFEQTAKAVGSREEMAEALRRAAGEGSAQADEMARRVRVLRAQRERLLALRRRQRTEELRTHLDGLGAGRPRGAGRAGLASAAGFVGGRSAAQIVAEAVRPRDDASDDGASAGDGRSRRGGSDGSDGSDGAEAAEAARAGGLRSEGKAAERSHRTRAWGSGPRSPTAARGRGPPARAGRAPGGEQGASEGAFSPLARARAGPGAAEEALTEEELSRRRVTAMLCRRMRQDMLASAGGDAGGSRDDAGGSAAARADDLTSQLERVERLREERAERERDVRRLLRRGAR
jgi:hypothetical protein